MTKIENNELSLGNYNFYNHKGEEDNSQKQPNPADPDYTKRNPDGEVPYIGDAYKTMTADLTRQLKMVMQNNHY
ncbi:MAG: hypothetical protein SH856_03825 [Flavobacteriales bacterium]|nr:hypothetical protein [Flavobacteriales bacterium]